MPDIAALVTPPLLLDSTGRPANGDIYARLTNNVTIGTGVATPTQVRGQVSNGQFKSLAGAAFNLPVTPEGVAVELFVELIEERPHGTGTVRDRHSIRRVVSVPDQTTVTWDELIDTIPVESGGDVVIPSWVALTQAAAAAAATNAANAAASKDLAVAAQVAAVAARDAAQAVPTTTDGLIAGRINDGASATVAALASKYVVNSVADLASLTFTAELQAKIDAMAANGGGIVEIPKGLAGSFITAPIRLKSGVQVRGRGKTATLLSVSGDFPAFKSDSVNIVDVGLANLYLTRSLAAPTSPMIDWTGIGHSYIEDLSINQSGASRGTSVGVLYGINSYYNRIVGVQVRGFDTAHHLKEEANRNRFIGNNLAYNCNTGFRVNFSNSNTFVGAAVEHCDVAGFVFENAAKFNSVFGCGVEDVPMCYLIDTTGTPAISNYVIGNLAFERSGGTRYSINRAANVVIDPTSTNQLGPSTGRTYVKAIKASTQAAWGTAYAKVLFQTEMTDQISEYDGTTSTFTAALTGLYRISASVNWITTAIGTHLELAVYKNGAIAGKIADLWTPTAQAHDTMGSLDIALTAGDTLDVWARPSVTNGINAGANDTYVTVVRTN